MGCDGAGWLADFLEQECERRTVVVMILSHAAAPIFALSTDR